MMKYLLLIAALNVGLACRKTSACKGNCADMVITGRVYDVTTDKGIPDHILIVNRKTKGCLLCNIFSEVAKIYSDANGNFSAKITIDTTDFYNTYLVISAAERAGYKKLFQDTSVNKYTPSLFLDVKFQP